MLPCTTGSVVYQYATPPKYNACEWVGEHVWAGSQSCHEYVKRYTDSAAAEEASDNHHGRRSKQHKKRTNVLAEGMPAAREDRLRQDAQADRAGQLCFHLKQKFE